MKPNILDFQTYCWNLLGVQTHLVPWKETGKLPLLLRDAYDFHQVDLFGTPILLAEDKRTEEQPPGVLKKQLALISTKWKHPVVYVRPRITSFHRQRLIRDRVPFVIPGNQMYLPMLCTDLRERFPGTIEEKPALCPSTQALILYVLNRGMKGDLTPGAMARLLGYTPMTMTRAFKELEQLKVGIQVKERKTRRLFFKENRKELWTKTLALMGTPVKKLHYVEGNLGGHGLKTAGLTALAQHSLIAEPAIPVYACGTEKWTTLQHECEIIPYPETGAAQVEVWKYRPELLADGNDVDLFSLFLSLRDEENERVAAAREEIMEKMKW